MANQIIDALVLKQIPVAENIITKYRHEQVVDASAIERLIDDIIAKNPQQVADYRAGKEKLFGFFVGQAMKASGGKVNPQQLNEVLKKKLQG